MNVLSGSLRRERRSLMRSQTLCYSSLPSLSAFWEAPPPPSGSAPSPPTDTPPNKAKLP